jgi:hypothetical protein
MHATQTQPVARLRAIIGFEEAQQLCWGADGAASSRCNMTYAGNPPQASMPDDIFSEEVMSRHAVTMDDAHQSFGRMKNRR